MDPIITVEQRESLCVAFCYGISDSDLHEAVNSAGSKLPIVWVIEKACEDFIARHAHVLGITDRSQAAR